MLSMIRGAQSSKRRKVTIRTVFFRDLLVLATLTVLLSGCAGGRATTPLARNGVIDLSRIDIIHSGPIRINGQWAFYWKRLVPPDDFAGPHPPVASAWLSLPGAWNGAMVAGKELGGKGYATFRLRVLTGPVHGDLAVRVRGFHSACGLWANGKLIAKNGVVGKSASEEIPAQSISIARLPVHGRSIDLVLQVSNFHYHEGGVVSSLELGSFEKLEAEQILTWGLALFCIGSILTIGLYHLLFFCLHRKMTAALYFASYCFLLTGFQLTDVSTDWVGKVLFKHIPDPIFLNLICLVISVPTGYRFLRALYPADLSRRIQQASWTVAAVFAFSGIILSTMTFSSIIPVYYVFCSLLILYCMVGLLAATLKKRQGAMFSLLGFIAFGFAGLNDMLYDMQLIRSVYLLEWGMFVFILFQAFVLSLRFSRAFTAVEQLSGKLADNNLLLEKEMAERLRLEREIVNITEEERRRLGHDLHDGLCQLLTGTRLHFSALRYKLVGEDQPPDWHEVSELLERSVILAYDLCRGLWPVDRDPRGVSPSLKELTRRISESSGIAIEFQRRRGCIECSNTGVTQIFRIAQEAITNAVKHAKPKKIVVGFDCAARNTITLTVRDDGIGRNNGSWTRTKGGLGIAIMSYRARTIGGTLTVSDGEGRGTVVTCTAPCEVYSKEDSKLR